MSAAVFRALGDPERLALFEKLLDCGPLSLKALSLGAGVTRQAMRKRLDLFESSGLATLTPKGRELIIELQPEAVISAQRYLQWAERRWDERLLALKAHVEGS